METDLFPTQLMRCPFSVLSFHSQAEIKQYPFQLIPWKVKIITAKFQHRISLSRAMEVWGKSAVTDEAFIEEFQNDFV